MKISIVTATYNSWPYIKETYDSIANQSYKNWEW
ncbi:TPA: glycosyltransferase, partial [Escherichia coli]